MAPPRKYEVGINFLFQAMNGETLDEYGNESCLQSMQ